MKKTICSVIVDTRKRIDSKKFWELKYYHSGNLYIKFEHDWYQVLLVSYKLVIFYNIIMFHFSGTYNLKPVLMNGRLQDLRIGEVEKICGYEPGYTNNNIPDKKRLQLLGNSFSINAFCALLQGLKIFFKSKNKENTIIF